MYWKFRNIPIIKDFPPICPYFLGFRVGKYVTVVNRSILISTYMYSSLCNNISAESHKGINAVKQCNVENQKDAITVQSPWW